MDAGFMEINRAKKKRIRVRRQDSVGADRTNGNGFLLSRFFSLASIFLFSDKGDRSKNDNNQSEI